MLGTHHNFRGFEFPACAGLENLCLEFQLLFSFQRPTSPPSPCQGLVSGRHILETFFGASREFFDSLFDVASRPNLHTHPSHLPTDTRPRSIPASKLEPDHAAPLIRPPPRAHRAGSPSEWRFEAPSGVIDVEEIFLSVEPFFSPSSFERFRSFRRRRRAGRKMPEVLWSARGKVIFLFRSGEGTNSVPLLALPLPSPTLRAGLRPRSGLYRVRLRYGTCRPAPPAVNPSS